MRGLSMFVLNQCLSHRYVYSFSKIIKMTPRATSNTNSKESIIKSLNSAQDILMKFAPSKPSSSTSFSSSQQKPTNPQTITPPVQQQEYTLASNNFVEMISKINIEQFEKNLLGNSTSEEINQIIERLKRENVLQSVIEVLVGLKSLTPKEKQFLTRFFYCLSFIMKKKVLQFKQIDLPYLKDFMETFNQYFILMHLTNKLVINYLFLMNYMISSRTIDSTRAYFVNQKLVIDYALDNKSSFFIGKKDVVQILGYLSYANVLANYPQKYYEFTKIVLSYLGNDWYRDPYYNKKKLTGMLYSLNYDCKKITNGFQYLMNQEITMQNCQTVIIALKSYISMRAQIFDKKPLPKEYLEPLKRVATFIRQQKSIKNQTQKTFNPYEKQDWEFQIYKGLIPILFRASIWVQDIWFEFADWLDTDKNYKKMPVISIYTTFDLLTIDKDIIPEAVIQRLQKSKNHLLLKNSFRIQDVDLIKVYHTEFGERMKASYSVQQQIANNLRSVSQITVKTESLIHFFIVDILMNDNTIIEINNQMHYIQNENQQEKKVNLKSAFRKRILEKLGYKFLEFEVDSFVEGNYEFLKIMEKEFKKEAVVV